MNSKSLSLRFLYENQRIAYKEILNDPLLTDKQIQFLFSHRLFILEDEVVQIRFVGLISFNNILFCVIPKYIARVSTDSEKLRKFKQVLQILEKYQYTLGLAFEELEFLEKGYSEDSEISEFSLAQKLLDDFRKNGNLVKRVEKQNLDGVGDIDWDDTIHETECIFSKKYPVYINPIYSFSEQDPRNIIKRIHLCVVEVLRQKYSDFIRISFHEELTSETLESIGSKEYLLFILNKELSVRFSDREISVIKGLEAYISCYYHSDSLFNTVFGVRRFEHVWETVCRAIIGHDRDDLDIPKPLWEIYNHEFYSKRTLTPDIIKTGYRINELLVFDAKYYHVRRKGNDYTNLPGVQDITKQYLYLQSLSRGNIVVTLNAFIFPSENEGINDIGRISFEELFYDDEIRLFTLEPEMAYRAYIENTKISIDLFLD